VRIIPISQPHETYAHNLSRTITDRGHRPEVQPTGGTVAAAIRTAEEAKVPFMAVIGDRETDTGTVTIRARGGQQLGTMATEVFLDRLDRTVTTKATDAELAS
jgi:threonyl-tRNA synthetase